MLFRNYYYDIKEEYINKIKKVSGFKKFLETVKGSDFYDYSSNIIKKRNKYEMLRNVFWKIEDDIKNIKDNFKHQLVNKDQANQEFLEENFDLLNKISNIFSEINV